MIHRRLTRMGVLRRRRPHWLLIGLLPAVPLVLVVNATAQDGSILIQTPYPPDVLYVISGDGANALALIGDEGVVLIDAMDAGSTPQMLEAIRGVSDKPVTTIINTHAHADHVGGNVNIPTAKRIVAHENATAAMKRMPMFDGANARFLPNETVSETLSLLDGPDRIDLYYFGRGHTSGDLVVVFPEKGTAYLGDLFPSKRIPVIDRAGGGSILALTRTLSKVVSTLQGIHAVVPGHEAPTMGQLHADKPGSTMPMTVAMSWADFEEYTAFVADFVTAVQSSREQGLTAKDAAVSVSLSERYRSYDMQHARAAIDAIYAEMEGR